MARVETTQEDQGDGAGRPHLVVEVAEAGFVTERQARARFRSPASLCERGSEIARLFRSKAADEATEGGARFIAASLGSAADQEL